jgi:hypothetical protein
MHSASNPNLSTLPPTPLLKTIQPHTYVIGTLNINGLYSTTKIRMLDDFLHINSIDILCLEEVTNDSAVQIKHYAAHVNIGTE